MAIKQIDLYSISNDNISSIEGEINLLKNLDHPNIVKYIECIRTKSHINLILEYVENGSLHQMVKQSGKMGEHLFSLNKFWKVWPTCIIRVLYIVILKVLIYY